MRLAPLLLLPIAALLVGGCQQAQSLGGKARPKRYRAIVSLAPSTTEILAGNNVPLVGHTSADDYPPRLPGAVVGGVKPDYEAIARIHPDLIVYDGELYGDAEIRKLESTGAKLYKFDPQTLDEYTRSIYELGSLVAAETTFSAYVDRIYGEKSTAEGDEPSPRPKVALVMPDSSGHHLIGGTKGLRAECLRIAGGDQVGPDSAKFEPLSPEFLVAQDPDVIILASDDRTAFDSDARFKGLKAVRTGHVHTLPPDVILRRGARVDKLIKGFHKAFTLATQSAPATGAAPATGTTPGTN